MNENEKTMSASDIVTPEANLNADANLECADRNVTGNVCVEESSPSEAISEYTDNKASDDKGNNSSESCAEESSPVEDLSEATDRIEGIAEAEGKVHADSSKRFHYMNKQELVDALKEIVDKKDVESYKEVGVIKQSFYIIHNKEVDDALMQYIDEGNSPETFVSPSDPLETELKALNNAFKQMRTAHLEAEEAKLLANKSRCEDILAKMKALIDDIDNINLNFNDFRDLQQQFRDIKELPATSETELWKQFQRAGEEFYDRLKVNRELRDLDFKKNLEAKESLVAEAVKLQEVEDILAAFNRQRILKEQWREIGPVAKEYRETIWEKFREACTVIAKRHQDYFTARKAEEMAAQSRKTDLCDRIEGIDISAIDSYKKWDEATKTVLDLQQKWKDAGFASRKINNQLFTRFREACDKFFEAKTSFFKAAKVSQSENLAKKIELCEKVEALKEKVDVEDLSALRDACNEIAVAQEKWKSIGPVSRKQSDAVWKRFNEVCHFFYTERKQRTSEQRKQESANLAKKRDILAQLKEIDTTGDRQEYIAKLRELQGEWQSAGFVPIKAKNALQEEYRQLVKELSEKLDVRGKREHLNNFGEKMEKLSSDEMQLKRERDKLYRVLDAKRNELKTAENNLGFFNVKSSSGNSLLKEVERRIGRIKEDMAMIQEKINLLNGKLK